MVKFPVTWKKSVLKNENATGTQREKSREGLRILTLFKPRVPHIPLSSFSLRILAMLKVGFLSPIFPRD